MPAPKPLGLSQKHLTNDEIAAKEAQQNAYKSQVKLPKKAPATLKNHPVAQAVWRRILKDLTSINQPYVEQLDFDLLVDYCLLMEQATEIDSMRKAAFSQWQLFDEARIEAVRQGDFALALKFASDCAEANESIVKLDARVDQKRKLLFSLRQSLYLTPRSRARAVNTPAEEPEKEDSLDGLLSSEAVLKEARDILKKEGRVE